MAALHKQEALDASGRLAQQLYGFTQLPICVHANRHGPQGRSVGTQPQANSSPPHMRGQPTCRECQVSEAGSGGTRRSVHSWRHSVAAAAAKQSLLHMPVPVCLSSSNFIAQAFRQSRGNYAW